MNTTPSFEDIPEGHVILCYEGRTEPRKYMITTDSNGQVYYRVYFAEEIDFTADALPHDSKGILVSHVNEAFASYLEMTPVQVEQCGMGEDTVWVHSKVDGVPMLMMRLRRPFFAWG